VHFRKDERGDAAGASSGYCIVASNATSRLRGSLRNGNKAGNSYSLIMRLEVCIRKTKDSSNRISTLSLCCGHVSRTA
jgi:hypothetical protein